MDGLGHFGTVGRFKQEFDSDYYRSNEIGVLANGLAKGNEIAVCEWGRDLGSEGYRNSVADLEQVGAVMGGQIDEIDLKGAGIGCSLSIGETKRRSGCLHDRCRRNKFLRVSY